MPTLDWIGKKAVVKHHNEVPFHLLKEASELSIGSPDNGNLLVEGDNLLALKALLPYYAGKVKCVCIDPPYNTGNEGWIYNDNVNSAEVRAWLGKAVGAELEDLSRHDKWLCMMYPRLCLLRELLSNDGAILVHIDDFEVDRLKMMMGEIFGPANHVCTLIWKRRTSPDSRNLNGVSGDHEYVLCFRKAANLRFRGSAKDLTKYTNPDNDPKGPWMSDNLTGLANATERPNLHYNVVHPITGQHYPPHSSRGWIYGPEKMGELIADGRILWPTKPTGRPRLKRYMTDMKTETTGFSTMLDAPGNVSATKELADILGPKVFAFPKPVGLIRQLIEQITDKDSIVLDSFAGSGTTAHAVMVANRKDGGNRRFIIVEIDATISRKVAAVRLERVCIGYEAQSGKHVEGLGSGFRYCRLGARCFDEQGRINQEVTFADLARHVYFTETGEPSPPIRKKSPLIGVYRGTGIYLLYNGVLMDKSVSGGNVLTPQALETLPRHDGPKVIYGNACRLSRTRRAREGIVFKQIPYEIRVR
jgi:site-specific DNA-methyltransferase (adenine-specific)/adenine-specific DNA-methyltransferase